MQYSVTMPRLVKQVENDAYGKSTRYNKNSINNQVTVYQNDDEENTPKYKKCINYILDNNIYKILILLLTV